MLDTKHAPPPLTVGEKTLAALRERLAELTSELDVETDDGWRRHIEREIADIRGKIERALEWADKPMGLALVVKPTCGVLRRGVECGAPAAASVTHAQRTHLTFADAVAIADVHGLRGSSRSTLFK